MTSFFLASSNKCWNGKKNIKISMHNNTKMKKKLWAGLKVKCITNISNFFFWPPAHGQSRRLISFLFLCTKWGRWLLRVHKVKSLDAESKNNMLVWVKIMTLKTNFHRTLPHIRGETLFPTAAPRRNALRVMMPVLGGHQVTRVDNERWGSNG